MTDKTFPTTLVAIRVLVIGPKTYRGARDSNLDIKSIPQNRAIFLKKQDLGVLYMYVVVFRGYIYCSLQRIA